MMLVISGLKITNKKKEYNILSHGRFLVLQCCLCTSRMFQQRSTSLIYMIQQLNYFKVNNLFPTFFCSFPNTWLLFTCTSSCVRLTRTRALFICLEDQVHEIQSSSTDF